MRRKLLFAALAAAMVLGGGAAANWIVPVEKHVEAASGKASCLGVIFNCADHVPYQGTAFVQHGKVWYRDVTINQCGNPKEPGRAVCYVSDPGYKGDDEIVFPISGGNGLIFHVHVR